MQTNGVSVEMAGIIDNGPSAITIFGQESSEMRDAPEDQFTCQARQQGNQLGSG